MNTLFIISEKTHHHYRMRAVYMQNKDNTRVGLKTNELIIGLFAVRNFKISICYA